MTHALGRAGCLCRVFLCHCCHPTETRPHRQLGPRPQGRVLVTQLYACLINSRFSFTATTVANPILSSSDVKRILFQKITDKGDELIKAFQLLDPNHSMTVSKSELRRVVSTFLLPLTREQFQDLLAQVLSLPPTPVGSGGGWREPRSQGAGSARFLFIPLPHIGTELGGLWSYFARVTVTVNFFQFLFVLSSFQCIKHFVSLHF